MTSVFLIEDDPNRLGAVGSLLRTFGYTVVDYRSAEQLLSAPCESGCIVSDLRMSGRGGVELVSLLHERGDPRTIIFLAAHDDIDLAVRAIKLGAFDIVKRPVEGDRLLAAIASGIERSRQLARAAEEVGAVRRRYDSLSKRQKEVLWLVAAGCANKEISARLQISVRTVETYRAWVLERMQARTLADLVKSSIKLEAAGVESCMPAPKGGASAASKA